MAGSGYDKKVAPHLEEIKEWVGLLNKDQIAKRLGIGRRTLYRYASEHEELQKCLDEGTEKLIEELKSALKMKAKGFHYKEKKTTIRNVDGVKTQVVEEFQRYSPPDTGAIHLLLKNLDEDWRNDDAATMELKRRTVETAEKKAEEAGWS